MNARKNILTIAILTRNRPEYLAQSIDAALRQSFSDFTLQIYDDASDAGTAEAIKPFLKDPRVEYIRHSVCIGQSANYNACIKNCVTDFLLITHDDDRMKPDLASYALGVMQSRCSVNLVCTDYDVINASGIVIHQNKISKTYAFTHDHVYGRYEFILNFSKGINFICCPTVMLRVSAVRNNDLWFHSDIGIGMDTYFWMEFNAVKGEFYYINKPLLEYRLHNDQITSYELGECTYKLAKPVYELIKRHNLPNDKEWICRSKNAVKKNILKKIREDEIDRASLEHLLGEFNFLPENIIRKIRVFLKVKGLYRWCYGIKQFIRDKFHGKLI